MSDTTNITEATIPPPRLNLRSLFLYKMIQGHKIKWEIKVDDAMVIMEEGPANIQQLNTILSGQPAPPENVADRITKTLPITPADNYRRVLDERGIKYSTAENGQIIVNEIPHKEKMIMQFFDLNSPAPDGDGVSELREKYKEEIEQAGGTAGCTGCKLNSIQRKYRELVKDKFN